ncbi:MAG: hypothetical protein M3115_02140, partial [Thermoproteota archaeon]|nr:hypothetical protein [Thermoproteota archaeon]
SHDNVVENTTFSDIATSEYLLSGNSSLIIRNQQFEDAEIAVDGESTQNVVQIVDSGTIEVTRGVEEDVEDAGDDDDAEDESEDGGTDTYDTEVEPYTVVVSDGNIFTINS